MFNLIATESLLALLCKPSHSYRSEDVLAEPSSYVMGISYHSHKEEGLNYQA